MSDAIGVAILGLGNVGSEVARIIESSASDLAARIGDRAVGLEQDAPGLSVLGEIRRRQERAVWFVSHSRTRGLPCPRSSIPYVKCQSDLHSARVPPVGDDVLSGPSHRRPASVEDLPTQRSSGN